MQKILIKQAQLVNEGHIQTADLLIQDGRIAQIAADISAADAQVIEAFVPLAEMFGYATSLRSVTQGRAVYSMQFDHYDTVPQRIADEIVARATGMTA